MNRMEMREVVKEAIEGQWEAFERAHPNLARVVDQSLLLEAAMESLQEDESYREVMQRTHGGAVEAAVREVVVRQVGRWMRGL